MEEADFSFEKEWSAAFEEAQQSPPAHVWAGIDAQLANQKAHQYKKLLLVYRWSAAAAAVILIAFGVGYWKYFETNEEPQLASSNTVIFYDDQSAFLACEEEGYDDFCPPENIKIPLDKNNQRLRNDILFARSSGANSTSELLIDDQPDESSLVNVADNLSGHKTLLVDFGMEKQELKTIHNPIPDLPEFIYGVPVESFEIKNTHKAALWAGVSMSSGSFDPSFDHGTDNSVLAEDVISGFTDAENLSPNINQSQLDYGSGYAVSGGINLGAHLRPRLLLSTGIHYSAFNTDEAETTLIETGDNFYALTGESEDLEVLENSRNEFMASDQSVNTQTLEIRNEYQYLTVPLKAGYIVLDRKFNVTVHTGVSSNFLINAQLSDRNFDQQISNDLNRNDNYEKVYFNFISSIELGYTLFDRYNINLEPSYNQALTNFTNSNNSNQGKPQNLGIAIGLKYNF